MHYSKTIPTIENLMARLDEQDIRIETRDAEIAALKDRVRSLEQENQVSRKVIRRHSRTLRGDGGLRDLGAMPYPRTHAAMKEGLARTMRGVIPDYQIDRLLD